MNDGILFEDNGIATPALPDAINGVPKANVSACDTVLSRKPWNRGGIAVPDVRIAILDDDQSVRTAISRLLRTSDIAVDLYATSMELLTALKAAKPDCLILDLQMPGMSGIEVMAYLDHIGIHVPTVIITAHDGPGSRETCLAAGASAYLRKPLDADNLLETIDTVIAAPQR